MDQQYPPDWTTTYSESFPTVVPCNGQPGLLGGRGGREGDRRGTRLGGEKREGE